ncbi:hypothetical protein SAMN02800692_3632 [Luteibacter sp. UNC138MFCol5.1]|uniref:hypothetical protein n=1 Tax=Luteibacter sp. UNC138MFCol5.1 TaxID=1502774 RepID=UPI0008BC0561|nr:hypothetical protein [Luteibacter sp. UNC138MFCol5.1]SEP09651.1 hypothetical protein SAMN02800692_3632 [Luteibacter sp. UNC138MFCol5.1]
MSYARIVDIRSPIERTPRKSHAWHVLREAARVEPDEAARIAWYRDDPIATLGMRTAEALVALGRYEEVLAFLRGVKLDMGLEPARGFGSF